MGPGERTDALAPRPPHHAPKAKAPGSRTIPVRTPFRLTGKGSDRDGDKVTFLWEQNDAGGGKATL